ncbi:spliceosome-associated protein CWC27 homolog [Glandiceps talaboti]
MSNIYISEPPTSGKVLLKTTAGEIDIELWSKETPKACRNFVQLCMEGYYNGTVFHRVIQNFIIQGGDPTGTGEGGESIYGKPFKDEFHQRLRFTRRGLIAMANAGPNDNGSQFFFTLDRAEHLNRKHTLFAKVTGNTVYNMLKLAEVETDRENRPLEPHKIKSTEVLSNPFDDIIPRRIRSKESDAEKKDKKSSKSKATKNFSLLSFGEEAEEDEEESVEVSKDLKSKSKSAHDLIDDPRLSTVPAVQSSDASSSDNKSKRLRDDVSDKESDVSDEEYNEQMKEQVRKKLKKSEQDKIVEKKAEEKDEQTLSRSEQLRKESRQLKKEMLEAKKKKTREDNQDEKEDEDLEDGKEEDDAVLAEFRNEKKKYKEKRKKLGKGSSREDETLAMLAKFQSRLQSVRTSIEEREEEETVENKADGKEEKEDVEEEEEEEDDGVDIPAGSLLKHRLHFESRHNKVKDANVQDEDTFAIYDPRNPINKRRREESKQKRKKQTNR